MSALAVQEFGDGIMSAIDMFATIDDVVGTAGEKRLVITLNGKVRIASLPRRIPCLTAWQLLCLQRLIRGEKQTLQRALKASCLTCNCC